ncbi:MAG: hypothetical protein HOO89_11185 [Ferruginibacter sp.]|nr:hypothetical protein [Ferruginibacter sp.]
MAVNRDLLVLFRKNIFTQKDMDKEVVRLNEILFTTESLDNFVRSHEVIDLNKNKVLNNAIEIKKLIRQKKLETPFLFFFNKN